MYVIDRLLGLARLAEYLPMMLPGRESVPSPGLRVIVVHLAIAGPLTAISVRLIGGTAFGIVVASGLAGTVFMLRLVPRLTGARRGWRSAAVVALVVLAVLVVSAASVAPSWYLRILAGVVAAHFFLATPLVFFPALFGRGRYVRYRCPVCGAPYSFRDSVPRERLRGSCRNCGADVSLHSAEVDLQHVPR